LIMILPHSVDLVAVANRESPISSDWYYSLNWLKANTDATSYYNYPDYAPEYGVMCWWDYGNWIVYVSQRPVVANNLLAGASESAKFFLSDGELNAAAIMDTTRSKYVITDSDMLYGKLAAVAIWAGEDPANYRKVTNYGSYSIAEPTERLSNSTITRLHVEDTSGMSHFRLIYESPNTGENEFHTKKVKIFEYVLGAVIRVRIEPQERVGVLLNMTSNQGRKFQYINTGVATDGGYEIRIPYSTDNCRYETQAAGPYILFAINNESFKTTTVGVSEEDIIVGNIININLEDI
jgi:asparagine N-glycosylation enzyme membrane subunit Stt3